MSQPNLKRWKLSDYPCEGCPPPPIFKAVKPVIHSIPTNFDELEDHQKVIVSNIKRIIVSHIGECHINLFGSQVKGNWDETSDYDIIVFADVPSETKTLLRSLDYGCKVEINFSKNIHTVTPTSIEIF